MLLLNATRILAPEPPTKRSPGGEGMVCRVRAEPLSTSRMAQIIEDLCELAHVVAEEFQKTAPKRYVEFIRYAERTASNAPGLIFADVPVSNLRATDQPEFVIRSPHTDYFASEHAPSVRQFLGGSLDLGRNPAALRSAFGITTPVPRSASPVSLWHIDESTSAAYADGAHRAGERALGNVPLQNLSRHSYNV